MIFRKAHKKKFTTIGNETIQDSGLSWKATGMLCYLLSLPDNWNAKTEHLAEVKTDGISAVRSAMDELETAGYIKRHYVQTFDGTNLSENGKDKGRAVHNCDISESPNAFTEDDMRKSPSAYEVFCDVDDLRRRKSHPNKDLGLKKTEKESKDKNAFSASPQDLPDHTNPSYAVHRRIAQAAIEQNGQTVSIQHLRQLMKVIDDCTEEWTLEQQEEMLPQFISLMHDKGTPIQSLPGILQFHSRPDRNYSSHPYGQISASRRPDPVERPVDLANEMSLAIGEHLLKRPDYLSSGQVVKEVVARRKRLKLSELPDEEVAGTDDDWEKADRKKRLIKEQLNLLEVAHVDE